MNKILIYIAIAFVFNSCVNDQMFPRPEKPWEGWAGSPQKPGKEPYDFFYVKSSARASQNALDKKSLFMVRDTCKDAGILSGKADLFAKLYQEAIDQCGGECDGAKSEQIKKLQNKFNDIKTKECNPVAPKEEFEGSEWRQCECVLYTNIPGGKSTLSVLLKD